MSFTKWEVEGKIQLTKGDDIAIKKEGYGYQKGEQAQQLPILKQLILFYILLFFKNLFQLI